MIKFLFCSLIVLSIGCSQNIISPISYDSRDYEFNEEILKVLSEGGDVGFSATRFSFVSEYKQILETYERSDSIQSILPDSVWKKLSGNLLNSNAQEYILQKATEHEILMFNENHFLPRHRNFVKRLLSDLYNLGYRYLAIEAIGMLGDGTMWDKELVERGFPLKYTGHYIKEPEFSLLLREAMALNFHIIGYDEGSRFGFSGGEREERGAMNILTQMDSIGTDGKLIVLCGWDHIKEGSSGSYWEYALAERLKQKTSKDPFTINQTEYNERVNRSMEHPLMQRVEAEESLILMREDIESLNLIEDPNWYDSFVIHPRTKYKDGIPIWILEEGPIMKFDLSKVELETPFKVFAFESSDEVEMAAPIYVCEVNDVNQKVLIPTRGKEIKLVVTDKNTSFLIGQK